MIFFLSLILFLVWLVTSVDVVYGCLFRLTKAGARHAVPLHFFPRISVIFSARNEAKNVKYTLQSLLVQDYPNYEIIAVNDRSTDETLEILESVTRRHPEAPLGAEGSKSGILRFAQDDEKLKVINIQSLPSGWLGKNHGLYQGYKQASGEWLLFTDADIQFAPNTLSTALSEVGATRRVAPTHSIDHLVLTPRLYAKPWLSRLFIHYFVFAFIRNYRIWACSNPKSKAYVGIGAFNLIRREAYEKIGTHKHLRLAVVDDMKLGQLIKEAGFKQVLRSGHDFLSAEWFQGKRGIFKSIEKNAFAGVNFNLPYALMITFIAVAVDILPFLWIFLARGPAFGLCLATIVLIFLAYGAANREEKDFVITFPAFPLGCVLFLAAFWNSIMKALREGGIRWRDTFYSIEELKSSCHPRESGDPLNDGFPLPRE